MNDAILLELEGEEVNLLKFREYGVKVYADTIFTTKEMIEKNPDKVRKFLKASIKGWDYAIENPEKSISQLLKQSVISSSSVKFETKLVSSKRCPEGGLGL